MDYREKVAWIIEMSDCRGFTVYRTRKHIQFRESYKILMVQVREASPYTQTSLYKTQKHIQFRELYTNSSS